MIAFSRLGNYGRLGNQLFQYAFLRSLAARLETRFYCPTWEGDEIFDLRDDSLRAKTPEGITGQFGPMKQAGYSDEVWSIPDNTDIEGYFQSEDYFLSRADVLAWYNFRRQLRDSALQHLPGVDLKGAISLSLRLDDDYAKTRGFFPLYSLSYYKRALARLQPATLVLVFADRPDRARQFLARLRHPMVFVEGVSPPEQLFLMTQCRDNVITNSTFAWWGAWLNPRADRSVIAPSHWCRPSVPSPIHRIIPDDWIRIAGTRPVIDNFWIWRLMHPRETLVRLRTRLVGKA